jgi:demethylmenaquinone methyltransferase/2-methoxy-6-polyprenyl-1,4-benzoquinol methylase
MANSLADSQSDSQASEVRSLFDRIAPVYDEMNQTLSLGQHKIWKLMAVKWAQPKLGDVALDICCGSGDVAAMLADRVGPTGMVMGVDFAEEMLDFAWRRNAKYKNIQWIPGDALKLPVADASVDCAAMSYGLRNVVDVPKAFQELYRVLKPGKKAAILDMHRPENPVIRGFQQWYLDKRVVPAAERLGFMDEYAYISPSLDRFPVGTEQVNLAQDAGFTKATHYPIAGGTMGVLVVTK